MGLSSITSGLNTAANQLGSLGLNSTSSATTLPSWYDQAQQNVVNQATTNAGSVPLLQNTVAGQAINQLNGPNNPFTQAQGTLQSISSGAANPWITNANGSITPNTSTALGGLAATEQQALNNALPQVSAQAGAGGTATGQFGSLRGQTAQQNAMGNAVNTMNTALNQAALQNQSTGANAASAESQSGAQGVASETTLGQAQQASPLTATAELANILGSIQAPTTVTNTTNASPLSVLNALSQYATNNPGAVGSNLINSISSGLGLGSNSANVLSNLPTGTVQNSDGTYTAPNGSIYGSNGQTLVDTTNTGPTQTSSPLTDANGNLLQSVDSSGD